MEYLTLQTINDLTGEALWELTSRVYTLYTLRGPSARDRLRVEFGVETLRDVPLERIISLQRAADRMLLEILATFSPVMLIDARAKLQHKFDQYSRSGGLSWVALFLPFEVDGRLLKVPLWKVIQVEEIVDAWLDKQVSTV